MEATDILKDEHELILMALDVLEQAALVVKDGKTPRPATLDSLVGFFRDFADAYHHAKEEGMLFPAMEEAGFPHHAGPVGVMLHEHEEGRALVGRLAAALGALDGEAGRAEFGRAAMAYVELLRHHIAKENQVLFHLAEQALDDAAKQRLGEGFAAHLRASGPRPKSALSTMLELLSAELAEL